MIQSRNVDLVFFADVHTGSTTALHPNVRREEGGVWRLLNDLLGWKYIHNHHYYLTSKQLEIWGHLNKCLAVAKKQREGNKLVIIQAGDMIEGFHHGTFELVTSNISEQKDTHIQLVKYIKEKLDYKRGDELYYLSGTSIHVGDEESGVAAQLGAHQYNDSFYSASFLELDVNGKLFWIFHEGVRAGNYPNRGNAATAYMKRVFYQCLANGVRCPDVIVTAHVHDPDYFTWTNCGHTIHYVILPSWQDKTRYAKDKMPLSINKVGMQIIHVSGKGELKIDEPLLMVSALGEKVVIK